MSTTRRILRFVKMFTHVRFSNEPKTHIGKTKLIPVAPDDSLRSYEVKQLACGRNFIVSIALWSAFFLQGKENDNNITLG